MKCLNCATKLVVINSDTVNLHKARYFFSQFQVGSLGCVKANI